MPRVHRSLPLNEWQTIVETGDFACLGLRRPNASYLRVQLVSLDDLVDQLIAEKSQNTLTAPAPLGGAPAAGVVPASGQDIGQSLSHLINQVSADQTNANNDMPGATTML